VIFSTRPTIEMQNLLTELSLTHCAFSFAEVSGVSDASACRYRGTKDVIVLAVVVSEYKLVQVQRQILLAYVVIRADDSAFQERPEVLNIIRVDIPANVLLIVVADHAMPIAVVQSAVAVVLISRYQVHLLAYCLLNESVQSIAVGVLNNLARYVSLAADGTDNSSLARSASDMALLVPMAVFILATDIGLINFDNAHELLELFVLHASTQPMAHIPCGRIRTSNLPLHLKRTHTLFAVEHLPEHFKPSFKRHIGVLKHCAYGHREAIRRAWIGGACLARPMKRTGFKRVHFGVAASRARHAFGPSALHQKLFAGFVSREGLDQLSKCHHEKRVA
jgi:hypothetical protein